jgi:CRISPR/Cas system-associated exonuclease Cas4 (RecB family)
MRSRNLFVPGNGKHYLLSRSRFEGYLSCPRCFYLDRRLGVEPPGGPPFTINSAVDHLLKKEFDFYRARKEAHPYMIRAGLKAVPFQHEKLDEWRENFKGVRVVHQQSGFELSGAVDDLWIDCESRELIVVDYKATSKDGEVSLDADWQISYKRQMEFYQWLMRQTGFNVSNIGYFVYCNGDRGADRFNGVVSFKVSLIPYLGDDRWIEPQLILARRCLEQGMPPDSSEDCAQCAYLEDIKNLSL